MTETLALSLGLAQSGTISLPGQRDRFTFTGTAGQRIYFDTFDYDSDFIGATLYAPSGVTVFSINHSSDSGPFYLTETGTHTLVVQASGDETGDYAFRPLDLANALS